MLWRRRFAQEDIDSLWEVAPGRGRKPTFGPDKIEAIVNATLQAKPKGMTQWSCRLMAKNQNVSKSTVSNIWRKSQSQAAPGEELQIVAGCSLSGEVDRRGRTVFESSAASPGALCG
jgi:hypothetical protein